MQSLNKVFLSGNLTREPELRSTTSGTSVCEFTLAVNEKYKEKDSTYFIGCVSWGRTAETIQRYCEKGSSLLIEGKLCQDSWEDRETGKGRTKTKVTVLDFKFLTSAKNQEEEPPKTQQNYKDDQYNAQAAGFGRRMEPEDRPPPPPARDEEDPDIPF